MADANSLSGATASSAATPGRTNGHLATPENGLPAPSPGTAANPLNNAVVQSLEREVNVLRSEVGHLRGLLSRNVVLPIAAEELSAERKAALDSFLAGFLASSNSDSKAPTVVDTPAANAEHRHAVPPAPLKRPRSPSPATPISTSDPEKPDPTSRKAAKTAALQTVSTMSASDSARFALRHVKHVFSTGLAGAAFPSESEHQSFLLSGTMPFSVAVRWGTMVQMISLDHHKFKRLMSVTGAKGWLAQAVRDYGAEEGIDIIGEWNKVDSIQIKGVGNGGRPASPKPASPKVILDVLDLKGIKKGTMTSEQLAMSQKALDELFSGLSGHGTGSRAPLKSGVAPAPAPSLQASPASKTSISETATGFAGQYIAPPVAQPAATVPRIGSPDDTGSSSDIEIYQ